MHPQGSHTWPGESKAGYEYKVVPLTPAYATVQWEERGEESYTGHANKEEEFRNKFRIAES